MPFMESMSNFWNQISTVLLSFSVADLLDICLVAFILYNVIKLIRETRAFQLAKGFVLLGIVYLAITVFRMQASVFIFGRLFSDFIILIIILFQPEIRHALESVGGSSLSKFSIFGGSKSESMIKNEVTKSAINEICKASNDFSKNKTGAIIVFEQATLLGEVISTGTAIDATVTKELIGNIFFPMSPLHDGAVIIRAGRICAAGCILPLTQNNTISRDLGTRHRAALGLSEESDAVVVVVSEETGYISIAKKGLLERNISDSVLREKLMNILLLENNQSDNESNRIKRIFGGLKR
jgi:diadenylate cyclase